MTRIRIESSRLVVAASLLALATGAGCPNGDAPGTRVQVESPQRLERVVARANANARKMDFLLRGGGISATVTYADADGEKKEVLQGLLLFRRPRDLFLKLDHTWDKAMELGSNDAEFWVWQRIDEPRYWWGRHDALAAGVTADMPVRPDHLLEVLGLQDLPMDTTGPGGPALRVFEEHYELLFFETDATGQLWLAKTMEIPRREPFLVTRMVRYSPCGLPLMSADLSDYRPVEGSEVLAPWRIDMAWYEADSSVTLSFGNMKRFDQPAAEKYFRSPRQRGLDDLGEIIRVDDAGALPWPGAGGPASTTQPDHETP